MKYFCGLLRIALLVPVVFCTACSSWVSNSDEAQLRDATVTSVGPMVQVPKDIDRHCVSDGGVMETDFVATVQYRVTRPLYTMVFPLRALNVRVGDQVKVNPRLCTLRAG